MNRFLQYIAICSISCFITIFAVSDVRADEPGYQEDKSISSPFSQAKFVPDISFILDFSIAGRNLDDREYAERTIPYGIPPAGDASPKRGFNLNYGELTLSSTVDPYLDLFCVLALTESEIELEEAYIKSRSLPWGFTVKAGKFLSSFGRLNSQHEHYWDFYDRPLILQGVFGDGLNEAGVQIQLVLPLSFYLMLGTEILQGTNEAGFGHDDIELNDTSGNRIDTITGSDVPNLYVDYIKSSIDIGNFIILAGVSSAYGQTRSEYTGSPISAETIIIGNDLTLKYVIDSYRSVSLQGEYLYRIMDGKEYRFNGTGYDRLDTERTLSGFYSQLVIKTGPRMRVGGRYEMILENNVSLEGSNDTGRTPDNTGKYSAMIEFNPTEFSRFRLQYNHDRSFYVDNNHKINNEVVFQVNIAIGAHGAHAF